MSVTTPPTVPALAHVTLNLGPFLDADGAPAAGTVRATPSFTLGVHLLTGTALLGTPVRADLDEHGRASLRLLASDAPDLDLTSGGWFTWEVTVQLTASPGQVVPFIYPKRVFLPAAVPTVDLELLVPADSSSPPTYVPAVRSVAGLTGAITLEQLAALGIGGGAADGAPDTAVAALLTTPTTSTAAALRAHLEASAAATRSELLGGAQPAWDTIQEIKALLDAAQAGDATALESLLAAVNARVRLTDLSDPASAASTALRAAYAPLVGGKVPAANLPAASGSSTELSLLSYADGLSKQRPALSVSASNPVMLREQVGIDALYYPCLVRVPPAVYAANPTLGRWRIYVSTDHSTGSGGIAMVHTDALDPTAAGTTWMPWRSAANSPIIFTAGAQTETPSIVWNPRTSLFHLYYHNQGGGLQTTRLATSPDGITWTIVGTALVNPSAAVVGHDHNGYAQVSYVDGLWVAWHLMGSGVINSGFGWSYSYDGRTFIRDPRRITPALQLGDGVRRWAVSGLLRIDGDLWVLGHLADYVSGATATAAPPAFIAPINPDLRALRGRPVFLDWPGTPAGMPFSWASDDAGRLLGAYNYDTQGTTALGLAVLR